MKVAWREEGSSASHTCELREVPGGWELAGEGTASVGSGLTPVRFTVRCDERWLTREAEIETGLGGVSLRANGEGGWGKSGGGAAQS